MKNHYLRLGMLLSLGIVPSAHAALLLGQLNTTGTVNISLGSINFFPPAGVNAGSFLINAGVGAQTGDFVSLAGTMGAIQNLSFATEPTNTPLNVPNFVTFNAAPNVSFSLNLLPGGTNGPAGCFLPASNPPPPQLCTPNVPNLSPFNLQNSTATSSTAAFSIGGTESDTTSGQTVPVTGLLTAQFPNQSYQSLLTTVLGGGTVNTTYSASFVTGSPAPEPGSLLLLLAGATVLGVGAIGRRMNKVNQKA